MKNLFLFFFFLIPLYGSTQVHLPSSNFKTLEAFVSTNGIAVGELITHCTTISNTDYVYNIRYAPEYSNVPAGIDFYKELVSRNHFKIVLSDAELKAKYELGASALHTLDKEARYVLGLEVLQDTVYILGVGNYASAPQNVADFPFTFIVRTDTALNIIDSLWFASPYTWDYPALLMKNDTTFAIRMGITNSQGAHETMFFDLSTHGEVLREKRYLATEFNPPFFNIGGFVKLSEDRYFSTRYTNLDSTYEIRCEANAPDRYFTAGSIYALDTASFIYGGTLWGTEIINGNATDRNSEILLKGNTDCEVDTFYEHVFYSDSWDTRSVYYNIGMYDTSNIYFSTYRDGEFGDVLTTMSLVSVGLDGTINWSYFIGGDASYVPFYVIARPNGGCYLIANVIKEWPWNLNSNSDVIYMAFDIDGQTSSTIEGIPIQPAHIYPNPSQNTLHIDHGPQLKAPSLRLFDTYGRLVLETKLQDLQNQIDVAHLASGVYMYQIWSEGAVVQGGKVLKM